MSLSSQIYDYIISRETLCNLSKTIRLTLLPQLAFKIKNSEGYDYNGGRIIVRAIHKCNENDTNRINSGFYKEIVDLIPAGDITQRDFYKPLESMSSGVLADLIIGIEGGRSCSESVNMTVPTTDEYKINANGIESEVLKYDANADKNITIDLAGYTYDVGSGDMFDITAGNTVIMSGKSGTDEEVGRLTAGNIIVENNAKLILESGSYKEIYLKAADENSSIEIKGGYYQDVIPDVVSKDSITLTAGYFDTASHNKFLQKLECKTNKLFFIARMAFPFSPI